MIAIPKNVSPIGKLAGDDGPTGQILVAEYDNGMYRLVATDRHQMTIIQGESLPWVHACDLMPDGANEYAVPIDLWRSTMNCLAKQEKSLLLASNGDCVASRHPGGFVVRKQGLADGPRFPDYKSVIPRTAPLVSVTVNPERLIPLLQVFLGLTTGSWQRGSPRITLSLFGPNRPLILTGMNQATEQTFDALLMPLT